MQRLAEGTREQQYGETIVPAQPPDWRAIAELAEQISAETRDLRVATALIESKSATDGLPGLAEGMDVLKHWVCDYWDSLHPELDEEDGRDPFVRINALNQLCQPERLPTIINQMTLVEAPPHTTVLMEDALCNLGDAKPSTDVERPTASEVEAALLTLTVEELRQRCQFTETAESSLIEVLQFLDDAAGSGAWDASNLVQQLSSCNAIMQNQLHSRLAASDSVVAAVANGSTNDGATTSWEDVKVDQSVRDLSKIRVDTREQAAEVLEAAMKYFERYEPSSPVPLLLRRAKRLINQDFVDILRDLAPDALIQAKNLAGEIES